MNLELNLKIQDPNGFGSGDRWDILGELDQNIGSALFIKLAEQQNLPAVGVISAADENADSYLISIKYSIATTGSDRSFLESCPEGTWIEIEDIFPRSGDWTAKWPEPTDFILEEYDEKIVTVRFEVRMDQLLNLVTDFQLDTIARNMAEPLSTMVVDALRRYLGDQEEV